jgi:hypothetical protein
LPAGFIKVSCTVFWQAFRFYACSSVCRELSIKFVRFYKNAISRLFLRKILKNLLQFLLQSGMLYPTKAKLGYILTLERLLRLRARLCFYLAIFFIYLLIIYPACPARDEKSDDPPARVVAFSFVCGCPLGWDAPECSPLCSGHLNFLKQSRALPHGERPV